MSHNLTAVILSYRKNRHNHRLIFGKPCRRMRRGWRREIVAFAPDDVFGYERWNADKYGTQDWSIWVCQASTGGPVTAIPGVHPGAEILLEARGKTRVKRCFRALDDIKRSGVALDEVPSFRWRIMHNDFLVPSRVEGVS